MDLCLICLEKKELQTIPCENVKICQDCWNNVQMYTDKKDCCPVCFECSYRYVKPN